MAKNILTGIGPCDFWYHRYVDHGKLPCQLAITSVLEREIFLRSSRLIVRQRSGERNAVLPFIRRT